MYRSEIYESPCISICLCDKWVESKYGTTSRESTNLKLINYLETKYLVHMVFDTIDEWKGYAYYAALFEEEESFQYVLMRNEYRFADRDFAFRHYGIVKFQKLWRKYYSDKLKRCKNIKGILMRQLTGKRLR